MDKELSIEEQTYYANYSLQDECDNCRDNAVPIFNDNDGRPYLEFIGNQLLCPKCRS